MIFLMSVPAQGPVTIYAPQPVSVVGSLPPERRSKFQSKLKILLSILVVSGILSGFYPLIGEVRGVLTQGGSAVTLDRVLDENFNLSLVGNLEGSQLISTATDSDPLVVNSTSLVDNLNASLLNFCSLVSPIGVLVRTILPVSITYLPNIVKLYSHITCLLRK